MGDALGIDFVDRHDIGVLERHAQLALAAKPLDVLWGFLGSAFGLLYRLRNTLTANISPVMRCVARNTRANVPGANAIQHFVVAVEPCAKPADDPVELIWVSNPRRSRACRNVLERSRAGSRLSSTHRLELRLIDDVHVQRALSQLFCSLDVGHGARL